MDTQVENAIELAFHPSTEQALKAQAYEFLNQLRVDENGWQVCLTLFTREQSPSEVVRLVCLELVNNAVQYQRLGQYNLNAVRERLVAYIQQRYNVATPQADSPAIQNKLTQTLTYLFTALYITYWPSFFDDFRGIVGEPAAGSNAAGTMLYLRIIGSIHDEIADIMISRTPEEQKRSNELKDCIRARDIHKIALAWQEILSRWSQMEAGIVELCLRTIAKWVSWIDISIVIDQSIQGALLEIAGQQGNFAHDSKESRLRGAAIDTFTETVGKKMGPTDKIELIRYLNLVEIIGQLINSPALSDLRTTAHYDTDLAETVAKLVNNVVYDIVKVLDTESTEAQTLARANEILPPFTTSLLRFFSDDYDEICVAVIPSLTDLLALWRRQVKTQAGLRPDHAAMLKPILDAIISKMKYDETTAWGEEDDATDEAEFEELRKRLYILQQTIAAIDEPMYINVVSSVVVNTFGALANGDDQPSWRDLDLALHEMYLFGELAVKNGGINAKSTPSTEAHQRLMEMMSRMLSTGLASHPHPAIQLHYMEINVRYMQYFERNPESIPGVLEQFVSFLHSDHSKVRLRSWYLFYRFVRHLRRQLGDVAQTVLQAVGGLLAIRAELPNDVDEDDVSSEDNNQSADATFTSQLYLFEAVGCVSSTHGVPLETRVGIAKSVIDPLSADLHQHLAAAKSGDARAALQVHHVIMALGTLANGFSDWSPGVSHGEPPPSEVSQAFIPASEAVLVALEALRDHSDIRNAARHAFSRLLGVLGSNFLPQLPRWIDGLLSSASSNDEMAMFLRTLGQVVYGFKSEIFEILNQLLTPLLQRVFAGLSQPTSGTDDEIQLKELKQQYLNFILVILNNELGSALVSPANQGIFDTFIATLTRFCIEANDPQSARLSFGVLGRMTAIWGGPDIAVGSDSPPAPALPGFDGFMLSTLSPLPWSAIAQPTFNARDAQMRSVLQEAAALQWIMVRKMGGTYQQQLQNELRGMGAGEEGIAQFTKAISGELQGFRKFFAGFVQAATAAKQ